MQRKAPASSRVPAHPVVVQRPLSGQLTLLRGMHSAGKSQAPGTLQTSVAPHAGEQSCTVDAEPDVPDAPDEEPGELVPDEEVPLPWLPPSAGPVGGDVSSPQATATAIDNPTAPSIQRTVPIRCRIPPLRRAPRALTLRSIHPSTDRDHAVLRPRRRGGYVVGLAAARKRPIAV